MAEALALERCAERGCPWPAVMAGWCGRCWERKHGDVSLERRRSALAEAQAQDQAPRTGFLEIRNTRTGGLWRRGYPGGAANPE